jgi:hypothetical protein
LHSLAHSFTQPSSLCILVKIFCALSLSLKRVRVCVCVCARRQKKRLADKAAHRRAILVEIALPTDWRCKAWTWAHWPTHLRDIDTGAASKCVCSRTTSWLFSIVITPLMTHGELAKRLPYYSFSNCSPRYNGGECDRDGGGPLCLHRQGRVVFPVRERLGTLSNSDSSLLLHARLAIRIIIRKEIIVCTLC